jgi:beta-lactamase class D
MCCSSSVLSYHFSLISNISSRSLQGKTKQEKGRCFMIDIRSKKAVYAHSKQNCKSRFQPIRLITLSPSCLSWDHRLLVFKGAGTITWEF